ncbi:hypothetical protein J8M20_06695 [Pseudoalteromonas luteoviolacea]|uniref:hypothetical protein n=1 Tax=Pseudoalteromonas luteoviolacea TaxID=43657 RepID=UPI001B395C1A|nr:hypothetical protein [Pseudoalteromonas luteoviolacea]MBQ4811016.1 hypothetical protein [Pseudoalteromonas luteoviolacea]
MYLRIWLVLLIFISSYKAGAIDLTQQIRAADNVVQGRVMSKSSEWVDGKIVTRHRILVRDDLVASTYGIAGKSELYIVQAGGSAMHPTLNVMISQSISHQVKLNVADEAIFFTRNTVSGAQQLVSGTDSVLRLSGIGTDKVTLPALKQLKVVPSHKIDVQAQQPSVAKSSKAVLQQEALTLPNAKKRIWQLIKQTRVKGEKGNV